MAHIDDLIARGQDIIGGRAPHDPTLVLELLLEIARNTRLSYDETRPATYETPSEAYDRGTVDEKQRSG